MSNCVAPGWGVGPWGIATWASTPFVFSTDLPTVAPFDLYCIGPCGPMANILNYAAVSTTGQSTQFPVNPTTLDLVIGSGGTYVTDDATLTVDINVPQVFTYDFTVKFDALPTSFADLHDSHIFFSASDAAGPTAGLFFSMAGLAYTGSAHVTGGGDLVLDSTVQPLPGSSAFVSEGEYWSIRIACDFISGVTYIFVTKTALLNTLGHQLRYVLPVIPSSACLVVPPDRTLISVRGTTLNPSVLELDSMCLGSGLLIPNLRPHADAGLDQSLRVCNIARLDGSKSFDPEGAALSFKWRLIDAPPTSTFSFYGADGLTYPLMVPTGFTDRLYSVSLGELNALDPLLAGDVLLLGGEPYDVVSTGTDLSGFYIRISGYLLPDNLATTTVFEYIRQRGLNGITVEKPTFYADVSGFYKFDLVVFDGSLFSAPSITVVNVVESVIPRGCIPDCRFLWNYLSDFWKLVDGKERVETYWSGVAQIAASELLNLWQLEYSKSLRDIQRTFQRRWLHYDLMLEEPALRREETALQAIFAGLESISIPVAGTSGHGGQFLDITSSLTGTKLRVTLSGNGTLTAQGIANQLSAQLQAGLSGFSTTVLLNTAGTSERVRLDAPFAFTIEATSTLLLFSPGTNGLPVGTTGIAVGDRTYRVERSLFNTGVSDGDFLVIDDVAYRIARITSDPVDPFPFQRVTTYEPLAAPVSGTWVIPGQLTSKTVDFWTSLVSNGDEVLLEVRRLADGALTSTTTTAVGVSKSEPGTLLLDTSSVGAFLAQPSVYAVHLARIYRRRYIPIDRLIVDVPQLQEKVVSKDDQAILRRNADFFLETYRGISAIRFAVGTPDVWEGGTPPIRMWAEVTYLDNNEMIEGNFGIPADFTLDDLSKLPANVDYLSAVRGLWFTYFNGPTVFNLRVGTQILLGLPFAEEAGTIEEIRNDFSVTQGRLLVRDLKDTEIVRSYSFPHALDMEINPNTGKKYAVGDSVEQFAPLVSGVEVEDYVKNPTWFGGYLQQGAVYEVEKFFKFLVRVDSAAFNISALLFVYSFILRVKPTYTHPMFVVLLRIGDTEVSVSDVVTSSGTLRTYDNPCDTAGVAYMLDEPRPAGGGWRSSFDSTELGGTPTYPTPDLPVSVGNDVITVCPVDLIAAVCTETFGAPTNPHFDGIFGFDTPVFSSTSGHFSAHNVLNIPPGSFGLQIDIAKLAVGVGVNSVLALEIEGDSGGHASYELVLDVNGVETIVRSFTKTEGLQRLTFTVSTAVSGGNTLRARIRSVGTSSWINVVWHTILVVLGTGIAYDTVLPAGTYAAYRAL